MNRFISISILLLLLMGQARGQLELEEGIAKLDPKKLSSVLVMQKGQLLFEAYFNGAQKEDLHNIRSASKTITGLMFGRAIQDGFFSSENERVLNVFSEYTELSFPSTQKKNMTFFDLLTMTNPLECDDNNNWSQGHEERMYLTYDWIAFFLNLPARGNPPWEPKMASNPYRRDFSYCTAGISITAAAIEKRSGELFSDYTQRSLFTPLGISQSQWPFNEAGITQGGGGLSIRPIDLLKLGELVLNQGRWQGKQLIPKTWVERSLRSYSVAIAEQKATYGVTWWQFPFDYKNKSISAFAAAGNGGNYLFVIPELTLSVVITATAYNTSYMHKQAHQIMQDVILPAIDD